MRRVCRARTCFRSNGLAFYLGRGRVVRGDRDQRARDCACAGFVRRAARNFRRRTSAAQRAAPPMLLEDFPRGGRSRRHSHPRRCRRTARALLRATVRWPLLSDSHRLRVSISAAAMQRDVPSHEDGHLFWLGNRARGEFERETVLGTAKRVRLSRSARKQLHVHGQGSDRSRSDRCSVRPHAEARRHRRDRGRACRVQGRPPRIAEVERFRAGQ